MSYKILIYYSQEFTLKLFQDAWTHMNYLMKMILNLMKINITYLHIFLSDIL